MKSLLTKIKALSDPIRLRIINLLSGGELCVCKIVNVLSLPQSTVSRHLTILKNADLVEDTKKGSWSYYKLIVNDGFINALVEQELQKIEPCVKDTLALRKVQND